MHLYNLTLQGASAIQKALYGNFSSSKAQEVAVCRGKTLELYRIDESGKMILSLTEQLFCVTRSIITLRFLGMDHDLLVLGSDSGRVVILEFSPEHKKFVKTHEETFGKTGCRRIVPGQYLAADPKGRAFMIAAVEKEKFVYTLNRENNKLVISSPREAHKSHTLCLDVVALDVGQENAIFICLEVDYGDTDDKNSLVVKGGIRKAIVYYEMDFGMNTVIRQKEIEVPASAHMLIAVPNLPDGPGGLIVVCQNYLLYRNNSVEKALAIPRRKGRPTDRQTMIIANVMHRQKDMFFFLLQSELGDIFKLTFGLSEHNRSELLNIELEYFDTCSPCISLCISKVGHLFCASEKGQHNLYKFIKNESKVPPVITTLATNAEVAVEFTPRPFANLLEMDRMDNLSCPTDIKVADLRDQGMPQIYLLSGSGCRSSLRVIKQGLEVKELATKKLAKPQAIWTLKASSDSPFDRYMVLSFASATVVLQLEENGTVNEAKDTGIDNNTPTLHVSLFENNSIVQVVGNGFKHIRDRTKAARTSFEGKVLKAASNQRQLVLALAGGDLLYFELDRDGTLNQMSSITLDSEVCSLDIGPAPLNQQRSNFLAVGFSDHTTRIFDLSPGADLKKLSIQSFPCSVESVCIIEMKNEDNLENVPASQLYLYVGLSSGMLMRATIDTITGKLADSRSRFLGLKPVRCIRTTVLGKSGLLALSTRPWLIYNYMDKYTTSLLSCSGLDAAAPLCIASCPNGLVGLSQNTMRIMSIQTFGDLFHSETVPLSYSPRKMVVCDKRLVILEYDQRTYPEQVTELQIANNPFKMLPQQIGQPFAPVDTYYGQVRVYTPKTRVTNQVIKLEPNEICVSISKLEVKSENKEYVCVGCVKGLITKPQRSFAEAAINTYGWEDDKLILLHRTTVEDVPYALHGWSEKLLAGIGESLRAYEIGKKKLLRKAELKSLNSPVNSIHSQGERIFATQVADSFHIYKYRAKEQTFYDIADDILPRYITCSALLDYHTMIGADKFQNIFISRAPANAEQDYENNPNSYRFRWENGYLNGAPFKMEQCCSFFVGEVVTCMQKTSLASISSEVVVYCTTNGSICALYPFDSREDIDFFTHLELYLKAEVKTLGGRDHTGFRSFYSPCKGVMDGDLCQQFERMPYASQEKISGLLERTPQDVLKKLQEIRSKIL